MHTIIAYFVLYQYDALFEQKSDFPQQRAYHNFMRYIATNNACEQGSCFRALLLQLPLLVLLLLLNILKLPSFRYSIPPFQIIQDCFCLCYSYIRAVARYTSRQQ